VTIQFDPNIEVRVRWKYVWKNLWSPSESLFWHCLLNSQ